ncbi:MAG: hypothetical protein SPC26_00770 [Lactobacillus amylovorus]|nr:hypothetical protein [Lactobacillus amylovorus]
MRIEDIKEYVDARPALTKIEVTTELGADVTYFIVTKTKETYVFEDESEADRMVDDVRRNPGFLGVDKKYKAGKMNKAGDVVKSETRTVVAKIGH